LDVTGLEFCIQLAAPGTADDGHHIAVFGLKASSSAVPSESGEM
jgi:hypothetical protein